MKNSHAGMLRLIAVFKFIKATLLLVTAIGILKMMHSDVSAVLEHWITRLGLDPGNHYVDLFMSRVAKSWGLEASFMPAFSCSRAPGSGYKNAGVNGSPSSLPRRLCLSRPGRLPVTLRPARS
jgi:hypothetical protein